MSTSKRRKKKKKYKSVDILKTVCYNKIKNGGIKMIYCANLNTIYKTAAEAARELSLDKTAVSRALSGERKRAGVYLLTYTETNNPKELEEIRRWLLYSTYRIILD